MTEASEKGHRLDRAGNAIMCVSCYGEGTTNLLVHLACALKRTGDSDVVCVSGTGEQEMGLQDRLRRDASLIIIDGWDEHRGFVRLVRQFIELLHNVKPDWVIVHTNWQLVIAYAAKRIVGACIPIVYWVHGFRNNSRWKRPLAKSGISVLLNHCADVIIVSSEYVKRQLAGVSPAKVVQCRLGVDEEYFVPHLRVQDIAGPPRLVYAAAFREGKGHEDLLRAIGEYRKAKGSTECVLSMPGRGPTLGRCREIVTELGLDRCVMFPGQLARPEMLKLYESSHCAVIPSRSETYGSCIVEPLVLGRIVVSRRVGVAADVITHGVNGFLFESQRELVDLLKSIMPNLEKWYHIGERAGAEGAQFGWDVIGKTLWGVLYSRGERCYVRGIGREE